MDSLIWFLIIFGIINAVSSSSKNKKQQDAQRRKQTMPVPPVYREQSPPQRRTMMPPLDEHPYAPDNAASVPKPQPVYKSKPVMQAKPKVKPQAPVMSARASLEGHSLEGQSMEGLPFDYNIGTVITQASAPMSENAGKFSREDMIRGIVMSEILDKPKALRR